MLVGGGDPTLSAAPRGQDPLYRDAARISDLADQVRRSGVAVTAVQVDPTAFGGPTMAPGWDPADIQGGDVAPIESVMVDGGRTQPLTPESGRSSTPALDAGRALAAALGVAPQTVTMLGSPLSGGHQIGSVQSAPLTERLREMMNNSDNVMAECLAREVAALTGARVSVPEPAHGSCTLLSLSDGNCMRNEQIAPIPRQLAAAERRFTRQR